MSAKISLSVPSQGSSFAFFQTQLNESESLHAMLSNDRAHIEWSLAQNSETSNKQDVQRLVIVAQALNFEVLSKLLLSLAPYSSAFVLTKNKFSERFGELALDLVALDIEQVIPSDLLSELSRLFHVDISLKSNAQLNKPGLVVFDMDSTIIEMECIDEIAKLAGVGEQVAEVTERAMQGEIAFSDSLIHRVACLKGVELAKLQTIRDRLPFSPGFACLVTELKKANWTIAIASGGFTFFADYIKQAFELHVAKSNELQHEDGLLTGKVVGDIVDADKKADLLLSLAKSAQIPKEQTLAVGDGANDLVMMSAAGFGVAYHAKPKVQVEAQGNIQFSGLHAILYLLS